MLEKKKEFALRFNADLPSTTEIKTTVKMKNNIEDVGYRLVSLPLYLVNFLDFEGLLSL